MIVDDLFENAGSRLQIGDPVIITGNVQFQGSTGDVREIGRGGRFVVVDLYNYGPHSFHASDVSYNDYADSDQEEADMYDRDEDFRRWNSERDVDEDVAEGMEQSDLEAYYHHGPDSAAVAKSAHKQAKQLSNLHGSEFGVYVPNKFIDPNFKNLHIVANLKDVPDWYTKQGVAEDIKQIDELSPEKLSDYKKKATKDSWRKIMQSDFKKGDKRLSGVVKAMDRLTKDEAAPEKGVAEGVFDMFKSKPLPKEPETIKLGEFEVELTPGNKYIGFAWKDSTGREHYEEVSTRGEEFGANNRNELIAKIKNEIKYQEKQIKQGVSEGDTDRIADRYAPEEFDDMMLRLKTLAGAGPLKTVWDPVKRVYKNVPINPPQSQK